MAFFAVIREGLETAVFLMAAFQQSARPALTGSGAILGIVVAVALGARHLPRRRQINLVRFFRFTGVVLVLVAGGLIVSALHTGHEAGWIVSLQGEAVDLTWLAPPGSVRASLLTGVLGLQPTLTTGEALVVARLRRADDAATCSGPPAAPRRHAQVSPSSAAPREDRSAGRARPPSASSRRLRRSRRPRRARRPTTSKNGAKSMSFALTDAGCDPSTAETTSGLVTFKVENKGAAGGHRARGDQGQAHPRRGREPRRRPQRPLLADAAARRRTSSTARTGRRRSAARSP